MRPIQEAPTDALGGVRFAIVDAIEAGGHPRSWVYDPRELTVEIARDSEMEMLRSAFDAGRAAALKQFFNPGA